MHFVLLYCDSVVLRYRVLLITTCAGSGSRGMRFKIAAEVLVYSKQSIEFEASWQGLLGFHIDVGVT